MGKMFIRIYVTINIIIILLNLIVNIFWGKNYQILTSDDWLIFIAACGALAISESVERKQELEKEIEDREKSHMNLYNEKKRYEESLRKIAESKKDTSCNEIAMEYEVIAEKALEETK